MTLLLGGPIENIIQAQRPWLGLMASGLQHTQAARRRLFTLGVLFTRLGERCLHKEGGGSGHLAERGSAHRSDTACPGSLGRQPSHNRLSETLVSLLRVNVDDLGNILRRVLFFSFNSHPHQINQGGSFP